MTPSTLDLAKYDEVAEENGLNETAFYEFCVNQHIKAEDCEDAVEDFREAYIGEFNNDCHFVEEWLYDEGIYDRIPREVLNHIDFQGVWDCELRHEFYEISGHYYRSI